MSVSMLSTFVKPMHPEGRRFVAIAGALAAIAFFVWQPLGWIGLGITVWVYYFFRDPERVTPERPGVMVSPADGVVSLLEPAVPPAELGLGDGEMMRIFNASLDKASADNERNGLAIDLPDGRRYGVVQIAGLVARRILCWVGEGQEMATGARFGLIRFGSRLDIYLPEGATPLVAIGQTMVAGETVIADLGVPTPGEG